MGLFSGNNVPQQDFHDFDLNVFEEASFFFMCEAIDVKSILR